MSERSEEEVKLEADIAANEKAIKAVEDEVVALGKKLEPLEGKEATKTLDNDDRSRLAALRKEKEQLREDKKQLRKKEEQLREQELLLLRRRNDTTGAGKCVACFPDELTS
jgi:hypothetical protein